MKKFNILLLIIVWLANPTFFVFADFNKTNQGNKENILFDDKEYIQINDPILKKRLLENRENVKPDGEFFTKEQ